MLTLFRLTSGLLQNRRGEGGPWGAHIDPPSFSYCDTNIKHLKRFWKDLGLLFNNLSQKYKILIAKYI